MTVALDAEGSIRLSGACGLEDAEDLLRLSLDRPNCVVDWTRCTQAHTAVVQILLALTPRLAGPPAGTFLKTHIHALLTGEVIAGG
jgi:hypothetical protein